MRRWWRQLIARGAVHVARLDARRPVHWIVLRVLPSAIARRFDPPTDQLEATFELAIRDPHGREPARFALTVAGQSCSVRPGAAQEPGARAMIGSDDLILLAVRRRELARAAVQRTLRTGRGPILGPALRLPVQAPLRAGAGVTLGQYGLTHRDAEHLVRLLLAGKLQAAAIAAGSIPRERILLG